MIYLIPIFLAFAFRERGSHHEWCGTQVCRLLFWVLPITLVTFNLYSGLLAWIGIILGHATFQDNSIKSHIKMGLMTSFRLFLILLPFKWLVLLSPLGMLGGLGYYLGYKMRVPLGNICVPNDTSWGELFCGALGYGLPLMIANLYF